MDSWTGGDRSRGRRRNGGERRSAGVFEQWAWSAKRAGSVKTRPRAPTSEARSPIGETVRSTGESNGSAVQLGPDGLFEELTGRAR